MPEGSSALKIVRLEAENVKRLRAVEVTPEGALVVVGGRNGQGKTSLLDSVAYALGGKDLVCEVPLRAGSDAGHVTVDLGDLVVRRDFGRDGTTRVVVSDREGARFPSPQRMLDELAGRLTFDPLAFARMEPREQAETLRALVGLDFSAQDGRRLAAYEERTAVNRDAKRLDAQLAGMSYHADAPEREVDVSALMDELGAVERGEREIEQRERAVAEQLGAAERSEARAVAIGAEIESLRARIAALEAEAADHRASADTARANAEAERAGIVTASGMIPDPAPIRAAIAAAGERNRKLAENAARERIAAELLAAQERSSAITREIEQIDAAKAEAIAAAKLPVEGLSFDAERVLLRGLPFEQASSAEQLRVSVAMGAALSPRLKVMLVRDGSLLDDESMRLLAQMAEAHGLQVWLERVGDGAECQVVIEDGSVRVSSPRQGEPDGSGNLLRAVPQHEDAASSSPVAAAISAADPRDVEGFVHAGKAAAGVVDELLKAEMALDPFAATPAEMAADSARASSELISREQRGHLVAVLAGRGKTERADALRYVGTLLGRRVRSTEDLTSAEYEWLLSALGAPAAPPAQGDLL